MNANERERRWSRLAALLEPVHGPLPGGAMDSHVRDLPQPPDEVAMEGLPTWP